MYQKSQKKICKKYHTYFVESPGNMKVGIADNVKLGVLPINGLRHPIKGDTTGWYIWAGNEMSLSPKFFKPLHSDHLNNYCPEVIKYLGLPPGWRFQIAPDYEDVWEDESLLKEE